MKNILLFPVLFCLVFYSCNEECEFGGEDIDCIVTATVTIIDQTGSFVGFYPVWIDSQAYWCDGGFSIIATSQGYTDTYTFDYWDDTPRYLLSSTEDYVQITYIANPNGADKQRFTEKISYNEFAVQNWIHKSHTFSVIQ